MLEKTDGVLQERRCIAAKSARGHACQPVGTVLRAARETSSVQLCLFDGIQLRIGNRELPLKCRKAKALIAYLALTPGMKETRDRLVGMLWSDPDETKARGSLRQVLFSLRYAFSKADVAGFSSNGQEVSLNPSRFTHELGLALASIDQGYPIDCLVDRPHISETLLAGYEDIDQVFAEWLTVQRENVRQRLIRALERQLIVGSNSIVHTKSIAHVLLQIDPTHEPACRRAYANSGNIAGALGAYKRLRTNLEQEYDIEPSATTRELVVAIKRGTYGRQHRELASAFAG